MDCKICPLLYISFRTKNEGSLDWNENPDSLIAFLKILGEHDKILLTHLNSPVMNNATYLSPDIQNELVHTIGKGLILNSIISEIKDS